jgi:hypothetical protein
VLGDGFSGATTVKLKRLDPFVAPALPLHVVAITDARVRQFYT